MKPSFVISIVLLLIDGLLVHYKIIPPLAGFGASLIFMIPLAMD